MHYTLGRRAWEEAKTIVRLSLFLARCKVCAVQIVHRNETFICRECRKKICMYGQNACRICGKFLSGETSICGECAVAPPPFLFHASYTAYDEPLKTLIHLYKYRGIEPLKKLFAALFLELHARSVRQKIDLIIPVPADRSHHREFLPVAETARILARKLSLPFSDRMLEKTRPTPPQAGLNQQQRIKNLRGAFRVSADACLQGKTVLLLDDVYTTGTTVRTCSRALARAGARVIALTLAQSALGDFSY